MSSPVLAPPFRKSGPRLEVRRGSTVPIAPAAPATPNTPSPADTATTLYTLLSWVSARATKFDLYLSTVNPPTTLVVPKYVGTAYVPTLLPGTVYYWQVVAFNDGGSATGPVWSFTTPVATALIFTLAGVNITNRTRDQSCSVHDVLNAAPNTASLTIATTAPTVGQAVQIGLGSLDANALLFAGEIQAVDPSYVDTPNSLLWPATCIDYTFTINKRRPFGTYVNVSATAIALEWIARYAPGFTGTHVQAGLPAVSITVDGQQDFMSCMGALATAMSTATAPGYCYVDYSADVHLFLTEMGDSPDPLDAAHPPLNDPTPITFSTDLSQIRTKVFGKGHSEVTLCDVAATETLVPIASAVMFNPLGGKAIAGTTAAGAQSDVFTYTGIQLGGVGSLIGMATAPVIAPTGLLSTGGALTAGAHMWAYVWGTAAGKSVPSPLSVSETAQNWTPPIQGVVPTAYPLPIISAPVTTNFFASTGGLVIGASYTYLVVFIDASGAAVGPAGPQSAAVTCVASSNDPAKPSRITITFDVPGGAHPAGGSDPAIRQALVYRIKNASGVTELAGFTADLGTHAAFLTVASFEDTGGGDGTVFGPGGTYSGPASAPFFTVTLAGVAIGPPGTTFREIYQTAAGSTQLQLQQTIANNTATTATASLADASLGANAPTGDTSGLSTVVGQVVAGATTVLTANAAPFSTTGGWATIGAQILRYTGLSGNTLTGVPGSGIGSLVNTVKYGEHIDAAAALLGVNAWNGLSKAIAKGSTVAIWVQRDDLAAQAALGLLELDVNGNPTDGIHEYLITNGSRGEASLIAECDADLAIFSRPIVSTTYQTRDPKSKSGKTVAIALAGGFGLSGNFVIQDVTITFDGPSLSPRYTVKAAAVAFTLLDLLRRVVMAP